MIAALERLYPEYQWTFWMFPRVPGGYWENPINQRSYWEWYRTDYYVNKRSAQRDDNGNSNSSIQYPEDWYRVSTQDVEDRVRNYQSHYLQLRLLSLSILLILSSYPYWTVIIHNRPGEVDC